MRQCFWWDRGQQSGIVGATTATLVSVDLSALDGGYNNCVVYVEAAFFARINTGVNLGASFSGKYSTGFRRVSGTLSQLGTIIQLALPTPTVAIATVVPLLNNSGNTIRAQFTGVALETIDAGARLDVWIYEP